MASTIKCITSKAVLVNSKTAEMGKIPNTGSFIRTTVMAGSDKELPTFLSRHIGGVKIRQSLLRSSQKEKSTDTSTIGLRPSKQLAMSLLAGLDNGIFFVMVVSCLLVLHVARLFYQRFTRSLRQHISSIHPDSQRSVDEVRSRLLRPRNSDGQEVACPICLDNAAYMVETNCGHCFCGTCFCAYWQQSSPLVQPNCPVCRGQLRFLIKRFAEEEVAANSMERQEVESKVTLFNRRFSGAPVSFLDQLRDMPILLRYALPSLLDGRGISYLLRLRLFILTFFVFFYVISPLDLFPEAMVGAFGMLDDILIFLLFVLYVAALCRRHITVTN
ncbi:hypothetical protein AAHC03_016707 [Spirometra sp. Aus1]